MKLILCKSCLDVFNLKNVEKVCSCGQSKGKYVNNKYAVISGPCVPIGFANYSLSQAIDKQNEEGQGTEFKAFIIPKKVDSIKHELS